MKKLPFLLIALSAFFLLPAFGNNTLNLTVKGMHCSGCETKFKSAASNVKGIVEVTSVNAAAGNAVITYDEKIITPEKAVQELADKSGFSVSASTEKGVSSAEGKPAVCCMKGQNNPSCTKGEKAKCVKKCNKDAPGK